MVEKITLQEGQKLLERSLLFLEQQDTDFDIDSNELLMMRRLLRKTTDYRYSKKRQAYITFFVSVHQIRDRRRVFQESEFVCYNTVSRVRTSDSNECKRK